MATGSSLSSDSCEGAGLSAKELDQIRELRLSEVIESGADDSINFDSKKAIRGFDQKRKKVNRIAIKHTE